MEISQRNPLLLLYFKLKKKVKGRAFYEENCYPYLQEVMGINDEML
jgi:hypothetical protein